MKHLKTGLMCMVMLGFATTALAESPFKIGEFTVGRGERLNVSLPVPAGKNDPATFIPLTVLAGKTGGPVVLIIAGVHGFEYAPILAAERLASEIPLNKLTGTVVIVRVAHVAAFENRSPYVNPFDRKNLNRSFPGVADGTQTQRIAYVLSHTVIPTADFVFDVHSGDGAEWLEAFVGVYGGPLASEYNTALGVAEALAFPNIVRYSMKTRAQVDTRRSLNRQAVAQGLPTVLVEIGENGQRDPKDVEAIVNGMRNALAFLKVLPEVPQPVTRTPQYFDGTQSVVVKHSGLWHPRHRSGRQVEEGEMLGEIRSYTGELLEQVRAPVSGYTIYGLAGPPVRNGDSVVTIAKSLASER